VRTVLGCVVVRTAHATRYNSHLHINTIQLFGWA
jgi:hypothetical protein